MCITSFLMISLDLCVRRRQRDSFIDFSVFLHSHIPHDNRRRHSSRLTTSRFAGCRTGPYSTPAASASEESGVYSFTYNENI